MKCENCDAYNAKVIYVGEDRYVLCPKCQRILRELEHEFQDIVGPEINGENSCINSLEK